jgi:ATP-dependent DNA helicase RecG
MSSEAGTPLRESEAIELKKGLAELKQGLVSMVAILNKHGMGELWFGIAPDGRVVGLEVSDKTLRDVSQAIGAHVEPRIYPQIEQAITQQKTCLRIRFAGRDTPYFAYGRAYMRVADEDRQVSARELEKLILGKHKEALRWDTQVCEGLSMADLDAARIGHFLDLAGVPSDTPENALEKLGLLKNGQLFNAARLFFARQAPLQLRCAVFASTDSATIIDRHDFDGDILDLVEEAQKYILKNIHIGMRLDGLYRVDVPEISMAALREAVINAFCHRDYRDPDYVQVAVFKNRVEIRNPGTLLDGLTIADIRRGNVSRRRNPLIAELLRRIHMVEGWGRGMPLMLENAPMAEFRELAGLFIASFARQSFLEEARQETADNALGATGDTTDNHVETTHKPLITPREKLLTLLHAQPELSMKDLADLSGASLYSVRHHLASLQAAGRLRHVGPTKGGRWEILESGESDPAEDRGLGV